MPFGLGMDDLSIILLTVLPLIILGLFTLHKSGNHFSVHKDEFSLFLSENACTLVHREAGSTKVLYLGKFVVPEEATVLEYRCRGGQIVRYAK